MINWNDPDYVSAGHFYTLVHSVNITCNDPTEPSDNVTSYVYTPNTTAYTPGIDFSNKTTISGAPSGRIANPLLAFAAAVAGIFLIQVF